MGEAAGRKGVWAYVEGGMGRVYEARHEHLGKSFAIKVLNESRAERPGAIERFLREARSATQIDHEHIVEVVNFDTHEDGRVFIVMELLRGESLGARVTREGPIPVDDAIELASQTAGALQAAHEAGIVHRDLKPENVVLIDGEGAIPELASMTTWGGLGWVTRTSRTWAARASMV